MKLVIGLLMLVSATSAAVLDRDSVENPITCNLCKMVGNLLKKEIINKKTEEVIIKETLKVCADIPVPFLSKECTALVKEYGTYYIDMLLKNELNIPTICKEIGLCSASNSVEEVSPSVGDEMGCQACVDGIGIAKIVVSSSYTLDMLHLAVDSVCDLTDKPFQCKIIAKTVIDPSIKKFADNLNPKQTCASFGACSNNTLVKVSPKILNSGPMCDICTDTLGEIKKMSGDKHFATMVDNMIYLSCEKITYIPFCNRVVGKMVRGQIEGLKNINVKASCSLVC